MATQKFRFSQTIRQIARMVHEGIEQFFSLLFEKSF